MGFGSGVSIAESSCHVSRRKEIFAEKPLYKRVTDSVFEKSGQSEIGRYEGCRLIYSGNSSTSYIAGQEEMLSQLIV